MWPKSNHPSISNDFERIPAHAFLGVKMFKFLKILICHIFGSIVCPTNYLETLIICLIFFQIHGWYCASHSLNKSSAQSQVYVRVRDFGNGGGKKSLTLRTFLYVCSTISPSSVDRF